MWRYCPFISSASLATGRARISFSVSERFVSPAAGAVVPMRFAGLTANADGLYAEPDFLALLQDSIAEYDRIVEDYAPAAAA